MSEAVRPRSLSEATAALAGAAAQARPVRIVGGATKLGWGGSAPPGALLLHTAHLSRVVLREDGKSATIDAGTPLVRAQAMLARSSKMLALDPQLGLGQRRAATLGGVVASGDSGPLSHRYGPTRDQVLGATAALSDGTVVRSDVRTQGEHHGHDLARLLVGSFGTLGVILTLEVAVRALPEQSATALGTTGDPGSLCETVAAVADAHPDLEAFDFAWRGGRGGLLARVTGEAVEARAAAVAATMSASGLENTTAVADDAGLWARQRAGQRSVDRAVLRVHGDPVDLGAILATADEVEATVVGRAEQGLAYLTVNVNRIAGVRAALPPGTPAVVLDLPAAARGAVEPWGEIDPTALELMREVKSRHDPAGICNPGIFVGGI